MWTVFHPKSSRIRQNRILISVFISWTNTGTPHCLTNPHQNNSTTMESIKVCIFTRAGKVLFSFSFRFKPWTLHLWNKAIILEPSLAIIFAGPLSLKLHATLQYQLHPQHASFAWESFPLRSSYPGHFLSSSELSCSFITPRWKEMGYFTDFSLSSPSPALH